MAVACSVHGSPRRGLSGTITGDAEGKIKFKNTLHYRVKCDDVAQASDATYYDAITAAGLPIVNLSVYSVGTKWIPYSICRSKAAKQDEHNIAYWDVTCEFESPKTEGGEQDNEPQDKPDSAADVAPKVEYSSETTEVVAWEDIHGDAIANAVGEEFAEPTMQPITMVVATITFYAESFSWALIPLHGSKVNDAEWKGKPRYSWLITDVRRSPAKIPIAGDPGDPDAIPPVPAVPDSELDVFQVTYTVKYNPVDHGWRASKLLTATKYLKVAGGAPGDAISFFDKEKSVSTTGWIDKDGLKSSSPVFEDFEHIPEIDFSSIFPASV